MISGSHQEGPIKPHSYLPSLDCRNGAQVCDQQTWVYCSHYFFAALALVLISSCLGQVLSTTHFFHFSHTSDTAATLFRIPFKCVPRQVFGLLSAKDKAEMSSKIQLYTLGTPNGMKIAIALEEMELEYDVHIIDVTKDDQFTPEFIAINPNSKIPAIVDPDGPDGKPLTVFESGAILLYLAQKTGKFLSHDPRLKWETIQWLFFQMAGVGPMFGQFGHFFKYAKEKCKDPYPLERYANEVKRLLGVLEKRLEGREYLIDDGYSIADMATTPWVYTLERFLHAEEKLELASFPKVLAWKARCLAHPATARGLKVASIN